jgi:hypothetical protein
MPITSNYLAILDCLIAVTHLAMKEQLIARNNIAIKDCQMASNHLAMLVTPC